MPDDRIDSLSLQVSSDADEAVGGIERLADALASLGSQIGNTGTKLTSLAGSMASLASTARSLKDMDLSHVVKQLQEISQINIDDKTVKIDFEVAGQDQIRQAISDNLKTVKSDYDAMARNILGDIDLPKTDLSSLEQENESELESYKNSLYASISDAIQKMGDAGSSVVQKRLSELSEKVDIDIHVNTDKMVQDIKDAINRASQMQYEPVKISVSADLSEIESGLHQSIVGANLEGELNGLPNLTKAINDLANAAAGLSAINPDMADRIIKLVKSLTEIDLSKLNVGGDFSSFKSLLEGVSKVPDLARNLQDIDTEQLNKTINTLEHLSKMDLSGLSSGSVALGEADINSIVNLGIALQQFAIGLEKVDAIDNGMDTLMSMISNLVNSAANIPIVTQQMPVLGNAVEDFVQKLSSAQAVDANISSIVNALASLVSKGSKAQKIADTLPSITEAVRGFIDALSKAPKLNNNVVAAVQSLSQLSVSGRQVNKTANTLTGNINRLGNSMGGLHKSSNKALSGLKRFSRQIISSIGTVGGLYGAINGIRNAIEVASDLTEVQNVVDVAFGEMSDKIEEVSSQTIEQFGMSELQFKKSASRFQAMGTSLGIPLEKMTDISIGMTQLAADMASFYNVEQDVVAEDLQAVFTGQTRPLRKYGVDLTQATLQEWALKNGMDANIKSMTQAEKAMLRYSYVMANTTAAHGDFARTSETWANQVRILGQNLQQLGSVLGGTFINALKPLVSALNSAMSHVITFAETVANALGAIFGWTIRIDSGGLANDFDVAAEAADEIEAGTGGAAKNAEKLNKYIAPWHEVNNMTTNEETPGSGGGGGGSDLGGDIAEGAQAQIVQVESVFEKYKSSIKTLEELGDYVGETLRRSLSDIDWNSVYVKAAHFGEGLADFLNGLISPGLFSELGKTLAGSLNTVLYNSLAFAKTFDWTNFGESIAAGINSFFKTYDFAALGQNLTTWAKGILDTVIAALRNTDWEAVGKGIGEFISNIDYIGIAKKIGKALWEAINAAIKAYSGLFKAAPLETALGTLAALPKVAKLPIIVKIGNAIAKLGQKSKTAGEDIVAYGDDVKKSSGSLSGFLSDVKQSGGGFSQIGSIFTGVFKDLNDKIKNFRDNLTGIQKACIIGASGFVEFAGVKDSISDLQTGVGSIGENLVKLAASAATGAGGMYVALGPAGLAVSAVTGLIGIISGLNDAMKASFDATPLGEFAQGIADVSTEIDKNIDARKRNAEEANAFVDGAGTKESILLGDLWEEYKTVAENENLSAIEKGKLKTLVEQMCAIYPELNDCVDEETGLINDSTEAVGRLIEKKQLQMKLEAMNDYYVQAYQDLFDAQHDLETATKDYTDALQKRNTEQEKLNGIIDGMAEANKKGGETWRNYTDDLNNAKYTVEQLDGAVDTAAETLKASKEGYDVASEAIKNIEDEIGRLQDEINGIDYTQASTSTQEAIEQLGGLWTQAGEEIIGPKAEIIYQKIAEGIYPNDGQGYYDIGNNTMVKFGAGMDTSFEELLASVKDKGAKVPAGFAEGLTDTKDIVSKTRELGFVVPDELEDILEEHSPSKVTEKIGAYAVEGFANGLKETTGVSEATKTIADTVTNALNPDKITGLKQAGAGAMDRYVDGLNSKTGNLTDTINIILTKNAYTVFKTNSEKIGKENGTLAITSFIESMNVASETIPPKASEVMKKLSDGIKAGLDANAPIVKKYTQTFVNTNIINAAKSALGITSGGYSTKFYTYGRYVVDGFTKGLTDRAPTSTQAVKKWADNVKTAFEETTKIGSPSKVTEEYGKYFVDGFNLGLRKAMGSSYDLVGVWAGGLSGELDFSMPEIDLSMPTMPDFSANLRTSDLQTSLKIDMDASMIEMTAELQRQNNMMEEQNSLLEKIFNKPALQDADIFEATRRGQQSYQTRTFRTGWAGID